ncbi:hypothetical protein BHE90_000010 [Fusarium euwallaceae]|uniref:RING-type domain-containing protein n=1 Tax=Fusarium euwallaceae TaxID=1147111 RepID=A0A430MBA4_9HYPO|nr:hypothetical protein BHE90_000010 [Fusarium euwallaceae]
MAPLRYSLAPLPQTGNTSQGDTEVNIEGIMVSVQRSKVDSFNSPGSVAYLSCDIDPTSSSPSTLLNKVLDSEPDAIVLYTTSGEWCWFEGQTAVGKIFTTVNASDARSSISYLDEAIKLSAEVQVSVTGNLDSLDQLGEGERGETGIGDKVVVVVSSIGGSLFGLFVLSTVVGAIRAYRHPERYGPRDEEDGHSSQTRIQGLARAVLDTFPVVKLTREGASTTATADLELQPSEAGKDSTHRTSALPAGSEPPACTICTEDFSAQEEVRVLPCKHEFHPSCIDPWLVQQSTKCPLCRSDFGPMDASNRAQDRVFNREERLLERRQALMLSYCTKLLRLKWVTESRSRD